MPRIRSLPHLSPAPLSRTSLSELLEETDPVTGEKLIVSMEKRKEGAKRGIRMIKKQSLLDYLERQAAFQCGLRVADHIPNSERLTIDEIVSDMEIFKFYVGVDNELRDERLLEGDLSTRRARITCLLRNGIIIRDSVPLPPGRQELDASADQRQREKISFARSVAVPGRSSRLSRE